MQPFTKQIIIGLVYFLIFALIAAGVYFFYFRPEPTCFDNKQNQGEEQIDCGGPCPSCELRTLQNLKVLWVKALETQEQHYDLAARIHNPNQNYGASSFHYRFNLYDLNNQLIATEEGTDFILPREKKYLVAIKIPAEGSVAKISLEIDKDIQWVKAHDYQAPEVEIFDKKYEVLKEDLIFSRASGRVKNFGHFDYKNVRLVVLLFDSDSEPVAVNLINIDFLAAGQERYFSAPWFFEIFGEVSVIDAESQVNLYE